MTLITYITHQGERVTEQMDCGLVEAIDRVANRAERIEMVAAAAMAERLREMGIVDL